MSWGRSTIRWVCFVRWVVLGPFHYEVGMFWVVLGPFHYEVGLICLMGGPVAVPL